MKEDRLTNALIRYYDKDRADVKKNHIEPEANYSHYGTRGYADLYIRQVFRSHYIYDTLFEIKGKAEAANEISRQFKKMVKYFYKDKERTKPDSDHYELCFISTPHNYQHVKKNAAIYKQLNQNIHNARITFRHPEELTPAHAFTPLQSENIGEEGWFEQPQNREHKRYLLEKVMD